MVRLLALSTLVPGVLWAVSGERYAVTRPHRHAAAADGDEDVAAAERVPRGRHGVRRALSSVGVFLASVGIGAVSAEDEQAKKLNELFASYDADGDGKIEKEEFLSVARKQLEEQQQTDESVRDRVLGFHERLLKAGDIDGDGALNLEELEYTEFLHSFAAVARLQNRMMKVLGTEGEEEGQAAAGEAPAGEETEDDAEFGRNYAKEQLKLHDTNENGVIDKDEYMEAMKETAISWGWGAYLDDDEVNKWLDELFVKADVSGDGVMNEREVQYVAFLGDYAFRSGVFADRAMATMLLNDLDENKDGQLDADEVKKVAEEALAEREKALEELKARREASKKAAEAAKAASGESGDKAEDKGEDAKEEREYTIDDIPETIVERLHRVFSEADKNSDKTLDKGEVAGAAKTLIGIPGEL